MTILSESEAIAAIEAEMRATIDDARAWLAATDPDRAGGDALVEPLYGMMRYHLGWADAEDENLWTASLGGEYQFASTPVSLYAGYAHTKFDEADIAADQFTVGVRYNFGGQTLKGRDRSGASFGGASTVFGGLL